MSSMEGTGRDPSDGNLAVTPPSSASHMIADVNAWGVAAFVCGLVGVLLGLMVLTFPIAFVLGVLALVFGLIGLRKPARRTMTAWGTGLGVVSVVVSLAGAYLTLQLLGAIDDRVDDFSRDIESVLDDSVDEFGDEFRTVLDDTIDRIVKELNGRN